MVEAQERNPLLDELKQGLGANSSAQSIAKPAAPQLNEADAREEMGKIIAELRKKMADIDKITAELEQKRRELDKSSPKRTEKILQEIKVPPLEMLK